jgi:EF-P beta-lysylation protein EpmB
MILQTEALCQSSDSNESWQQALANVVRDPRELFELLSLDIKALPGSLAAIDSFPLRVPRSFIARMNKGDWQDPLLQQVLPLARELEVQPGFSDDPLEELGSNPLPGLIHKYHSRVLLIVSGGCAINCRYCFRRHFPYSDNNPGRGQWSDVLEYIAADTSINEVILSGGDPLAASDKLLADLVGQLQTIPHLSTLRVHSRLPVVIPQRITEQTLQWLSGGRLQPVLVIHSNHANELDREVQRSLAAAREAGVTLLNQSVLLAGVNDSAATLKALSERLFACGVLPYYLHLLDKVAGAAHFFVDEPQARVIVQQLLASAPGYLVPRLVRELPHQHSKTLIALR